MKTDKLRIRVLLPLSLVLTALLAAFVLSSYRIQRNQIDKEVRDRHQSVRILFANQIEADLRQLRIGLDLVSQDHRILEAWQKKKRKRLFQIARPIFDQLNRQTQIEYFYFNDPDRVNFLRVHDKDRHGDAINRYSQTHVKESGREFHSIELDRSGGLTLRVVRPIHANDKLLGYIEFGMPIEDIPPQIRNISNVDLMILVDKLLIDQTKWEENGESRGRRGSWRQLDDFAMTQSTLDIIPEELIGFLNLDFRRAESKATANVEVRNRSYRVTSFPITQSDGRPVAELVILDDVTEALANLNASLRTFIMISVGAWIGLFALYSIILGRAQKKLAVYQRQVVDEVKSRSKAEEANIAKTEFLCNMSHEIRTPLNAIIGNTDLALETQESSEQSHYLKVVQRASESLLRLISDLLDFSRIEAGQMSIDVVPFDLRNLIEESAEILSMRAHEKGLELISYVDPTLPRLVRSDPVRLEQILINLVGNSIKFTDKGEIVIKVESRSIDDHDHTCQVRISVSDTGIGIAPENQATIFEKFFQADTSMTRQYGGTGLGLSISRTLIEMLGGKIRLESELGKGTVFYIDFDLAIPDNQESQKSLFSATRFQSRSVLVVDDNATSLELLRQSLAAWGMAVEAVPSGVEAVARLRQDNKFDVVVLKQHMPVISGIEVVRTIREDMQNKDLKIVLLQTLENQGESLNGLHVDKFLRKPVKQSKLYGVLEQLFHPKTHPTENRKDKTSVKNEAVNSGKRILLVEDNVDNQNLAKNIMRKAGFNVHVSANGKIAVEAVKRFPYDLIFMDIQMPVMDGFEATREIRVLERENNSPRVPIVALTAHALNEYHEKCLANDMDDYITKPIRKKILMQTIKKWTENPPKQVHKPALPGDDDDSFAQISKDLLAFSNSKTSAVSA